MLKDIYPIRGFGAAIHCICYQEVSRIVWYYRNSHFRRLSMGFFPSWQSTRKRRGPNFPWILTPLYFRILPMQLCWVKKFLSWIWERHPRGCMTKNIIFPTSLHMSMLSLIMFMKMILMILCWEKLWIFERQRARSRIHKLSLISTNTKRTLRIILFITGILNWR